MELPHELAEAIERELDGVQPAKLRAAVERVSGRYRERAGRTAAFISAEDDINAYLAYRMPATYAAASAALTESAAILGTWAPRTALDAGAGTGATSWAAVNVWPDIGALRLVDIDTAMLETGRRLAAESSYHALRNASWTAGRFDEVNADAPFDLVMSAYVLNEVPEQERPAFVAGLWRKTGRLLVIIDAGTPRGFEGIREARSQLVELGAHVAAPCPHAAACPMAGADWCHFAARLPRSRLHRAVKAGEKSFEDEKFSYIAVSREPVEPGAGRIIRHPLFRRGYVELMICGRDGLESVTYSRRRSAGLYRAARDARWGDVWDDPSL